MTRSPTARGVTSDPPPAGHPSPWPRARALGRGGGQHWARGCCPITRSWSSRASTAERRGVARRGESSAPAEAGPTPREKGDEDWERERHGGGAGAGIQVREVRPPWGVGHRWGGVGMRAGPEGAGRERMPRPPPHLARRGHGLALAPRPPRRGLPARPLRPDAAAGGESTQSLTLSLGNGCRKVPVAAISPSSRGVPGAVLRPATAPGELWGQPQSAQAPGLPPPPPRTRLRLRAAPHLRQPVHVARACGRQTRDTGLSV